MSLLARPASYRMGWPDPPSSLAPAGVVVLVDGSGVPSWAVDWCHRSGRDLKVLRMPILAPGNPPCVTHRVRALAGLTRNNALAGNDVLLPGSAIVCSETPRVVAAIRDLPDDALVLVDAAEIAVQLGVTLALVHGVPLSFGERSVGLDAALDHGRWTLETAAKQLATDFPCLNVLQQLLRVHPHELVGEKLDANLLVLGGPRRHLPGRLGLVASSALHHALCPILLSPRLG